MNKIGLIDVDGHNFPNLPLMKLSAYHKSKGDSVELNFPLYQYDIVYMSKVFDFSPDFEECIRADEIIKGGTGYGLDNKLPPEIESMYPDYSLYNIQDTAYGFLTRGCPRGCPFCLVKAKEGGRSIKVAELDQFWRGQKHIKLLDPNILACTDKMDLLQQLAKSKAWVDFTQGLDIRLMTPEVADVIMLLILKNILFAWVTEKNSEVIIQNLIHFKNHTKIDSTRGKVYVLTNYDTDFEFDLERIYKIKEIGYDPYVMIFNKYTADKKYKKLARWVNNRRIFNSCKTFEEYKA